MSSARIDLFETSRDPGASGVADYMSLWRGIARQADGTTWNSPFNSDEGDRAYNAMRFAGGRTVDPAGAAKASLADWTTVAAGDALYLPIPNTPPVLDDAAASVSEFAPLGTVVIAVDATDTDRPAQPLTDTITVGNEAGLFDINATTGAVTRAAAPDFETNPP